MTRIQLRCEKTSQMANLFLEDNGIGIPKEKRVEVMMRFAQAKDGTGSGLGLAIASRVMSNHSGTINIVETDQGTKIHLALPLASS